jgi:NitT/TauT family transport system substrate-binding protein
MPPAANRAAAVIVLLVLIAAIGPGPGCGRGPGYSGPVEKLRLGLMAGESATLIYIADREGFFREYGLEVEICTYTFGLDALQALERNEVDLAVSSEFAFVSTSFSISDVEIFAAIAEMENTTLVARRDRGINSVADLKGKKIGMKKGIQADFVLGRLLAANGLSIGDVNIYEGAPGEQITPGLAVTHLVNGTTDATILIEPYLSQALEQLGTNAFTIDAQLGQPWYLVLSARREYIDGHGETVHRVLEALVASQGFAAEHPESAQSDLAEGAGIDETLARWIWTRCSFEAELPQTLLVTMEDEARWAIENGFFGAVSLPNYLERVYQEALREVLPGSVTIY